MESTELFAIGQDLQELKQNQLAWIRGFICGVKSGKSDESRDTAKQPEPAGKEDET